MRLLPSSPALVLVCASVFASVARGETVERTPRLAVAISVDQLRYDYLPRFRAYFGPGGFERMLAGGLNFENCTYSYAATKTAVGHATMLTGCNPEAHGIIANEWLDHDTHRLAAAVEDHDAPLVGLAPTTMRLPGGALDPRSGRSPQRLLAPTVGDQLRTTYGPAAKVFGVSNKDRSAILMAGHDAHGAYWDENGRFVTSTYYRAELPGWVDAFNRRQRAESYFGATWQRRLAAEIYDTVQGPDDAPGEFSGDGLDRTFPHVIDGGQTRPAGSFYGAFDISPFASEVLAEFARELVIEEQLGTDDTPDLLCLSFSQIDSLGHNYGPDSHEIMDAIVRLDAILAGLLAFLDERIGKDNYVVVLTADHGVAPLPERTTEAGSGISTRVNGRELDGRMSAALDAVFGTLPEGERWFVRDNQGYRFRTTALAAKNADPARAAAALRDALRRDPIIETAFTREEVLAAPRDGTSLIALIRRSVFPAPAQDVFYVTRPDFVEKPDFGTNHGSPWLYDRHVPQLWYGAGVRAGTRSEAVGMEDIAPTLAALLRIPPPAKATGRQLF